MRKLFYILAFASAILFICSAINLSKQYNLLNISIGPLKGFDASGTDPDYNKLKAKFNDKIKVYTDEANKDQTWYFWMSFLVTGLTAASTLVSTIEAAKKSPAAPVTSNRTFAIVVAVLTFCSTLSNFGSTHFNDAKTAATKNATDKTNLRNDFFAAYNKAATPEEKAKVITEYDQKSD